MNFRYLVAATLPLSFLFACGDDSGSAAADNAHGESDWDAVVEDVDELSEKFGDCDGEYAYVKFEKSSYVCTDGEWHLDEKNIELNPLGDKFSSKDGGDSSGKGDSGSNGNSGSKGKSSSSSKKSSSSVQGNSIGDDYSSSSRRSNSSSSLKQYECGFGNYNLSEKDHLSDHFCDVLTRCDTCAMFLGPDVVGIDTVIHVGNNVCLQYGTDVYYACQRGALKNVSEADELIVKMEPRKDGDTVSVGRDTVTYVYDGKEKSWRLANYVEAVFGGCKESLQGSIKEKKWESQAFFGNPEYYKPPTVLWYARCSDRKWTLLSEYSADTYDWEPGKDGDFEKGDFTRKTYLFDAEMNKWILSSDSNTVNYYNSDKEYEKRVCTKRNKGTVFRNMNSVYYSFFYCDGDVWKRDEIEYETGEIECTLENEGEIMNGVLSPEYEFYCSENGWISLKRAWKWGVPKDVRVKRNFEYETMTDDRDGQVYRIVTFGEGDSARTWMAENLNYLDNEKNRIRGCYDGNLEHCAEMGRYYLWSSAIDSATLAKKNVMCGRGMVCSQFGLRYNIERIRGICPEGWHLPSDDEWMSLIDFAGGKNAAAIALEIDNGWAPHSVTEPFATDKYGFSIFPGGAACPSEYKDVGAVANFWTSSDYGELVAMSASFGNVARVLESTKTCRYNIRCIKDYE